MENKGILNVKIGENYTGFVLVKEVKTATARNGKPYLNVTLSDASGQVNTMVWDADKEKEALFQPSTVIKVQGAISEYQGKRQLNLSKFRNVEEQDSIDMSELVHTAPISGEDIVPKIYTVIEGIQNDKIRKITKTVFLKYENDFKNYPAARNVHHAFVSGLAYHTFCMLNLATSISQLYPILNKDLLFAGVIMHDLAKIKEYEFDGFNVTDSSLEGKLLGHIPMIIEEIGITAKELGMEGEEIILLQHLVGSHHGLHSNGWGSAVSPMLPEAEALHMIDMFDAKLEILRKALENVEQGTFTDKLFGLDNRSFYKHNI